MRKTRFIVGFLSVLSALLLSWLYFLLLDARGCPFLLRLILIVSSVWLLISGCCLLIRGRSPLSKKGKTTLGFNVAIILIFASAISLSNFIKARAPCSGGSSTCINNLRQIDAAANQFALEHHLTNDAPIHFPNDLTPYIRLNSAGKIPGCPQGGVYHISKVGELPTCTLSTATPPHKLE